MKGGDESQSAREKDPFSFLLTSSFLFLLQGIGVRVRARERNTERVCTCVLGVQAERKKAEK